MATVTDELYNDFQDSDEEQNEEVDDTNEDADIDDRATKRARLSIDEDAMELQDDEEAVEDEDIDVLPAHLTVNHGKEEKTHTAKLSDLERAAAFLAELKPILEEVDHFKNLPPEQQTRNIGNIEDNPEYQLLTKANTEATRIDDEMAAVHKALRDRYMDRFPELETMVINKVEYAKAVAIIGNGPMDKLSTIADSKDNVVGQTLRQVLGAASLMTVTVEATQTRGVALSEGKLEEVRRISLMQLQFDNAKRVLGAYVESRMVMFAPNLTVLIGSLTAAQLIAHTGGISGLAKTPACNLAALGSSNKDALLGRATNIGIRHQGYLYQNERIREVALDLRKQAMRILAAKIVLAARVDQMHQSPAGEQGYVFSDEVTKRINKLSEAAPNSGTRALPAPDDKPARKRGGRRARKAKEATAMTDLRKAQNRMAFGKEEIEVGYGDSTKGMGMIGQQDDGRIRAQQIDQRTKAKLSKKNPGWGGATPATSGTATSLRGFGAGPGGINALKAAGLRTAGSSGIKTQIGGTAGTATSVAFTPVQGIELINPQARAEAERKAKADEDRWFKSGTFTGAGTTAPTKSDAQGFKIPALPMKRPAA